MRHDMELSAGDICGDTTGLRVRVEEVDLYDYVHFSVVDKSESEEEATGEMSHLAFVRRFTKMDHTFVENGRELPSDRVA
jgi:hypothetical protein